MATAEQYADWLVRNESKRGTREFDTVAAAYKQVRGASLATEPSSLKGSTVGGVFMGLRDPIDAGAQLLARGVDTAVSGINSATGLDLPRPDIANVDRIVKTANAEYDQSREMAGRDGIDLSRIAGNIANPVNRIVPMSGAASTGAVALRAGLQGAVSGAAQPVLDTDNFAGSKTGQVALGAGTAAAGGALLDKLAQGVGRAWAGMRAKPGFPRALGGAGQIAPEEQAQQLLAQAAQAQGIDLAQIPASMMERVRGEVAKAVAAGKTIDAKALMRSAEGSAVLGDDAGLMLGQATRDPLQFASELDLRGIQNAGRPIAERLSKQNTRLIEAVGKRGATGAPDAYDAGSAALKTLQAKDKELSAGVTAAYSAFRNAGGTDIDVPLQPLAQTLGDVIETRGANNIPPAVKKALASYGLMGAKQTKVFNLLEADKLIKIINANFDPQKAAEAGALGQLRAGLSDAIELAAKNSDDATGPASDLLRTALNTAKDRFKLHEAVPALEDAVKNPKAQEDFVRRYITAKSASVDSVDRLAGLLQGKPLEDIRRTVLADILEQAAPGARRGSDAAVFSQAAYSRALDSIGDRKLQIIFGDEGVSQLRQVQRVAEWIQKQPKGSAVNNSNTGSAVMNLLQGMAGKSDSSLVNKLTGLPGVNLIRNSLAESLDESAARQALGAQVRPLSPNLSPEEIAAMRRFLPAAGGALGGTTASGLR